MAGQQVTGWRLDRDDRQRLLERFRPIFPDLVAEHVTLQFGGKPALPDETSGRIVGEIDDGEGVQALVVEIGGTTRRPDGSTFHITWSLDRAAGRKPVDSNQVIARLGWRALAEPIPVRLQPARI